MKHLAHSSAAIAAGTRPTSCGDQFPAPLVALLPQLGRVVMGVPSTSRTSAGHCSSNSGASSLSPRFAPVSSAATGSHSAPIVTARYSFQPYHQPCQPDLLHPAFVSLELWGMMPGSRCFLCQTPPPVASGVLSHATARPCLAHGRRSVTTWRPIHPISPGKLCGSAASRRCHVRRLGKHPCSHSGGRNCWGAAPLGPETPTRHRQYRVMHSAGIMDRDGIPLLLEPMQGRFPRMQHV
jgi:hypothetical protein